MKIGIGNKQLSIVSPHHIAHFQSMHFSPPLQQPVFIIRPPAHLNRSCCFTFISFIVKSYVFAINFCLLTKPTATRPKYANAKNDLLFRRQIFSFKKKRQSISPLFLSNYGYCFRVHSFCVVCKFAFCFLFVLFLFECMNGTRLEIK